MDRKWWTLLVVCGATFMLLLDVTIVIVALPEIQTGLHAGFADVQWVIDAYALTLASILLTAGSLADLYGRRLLFTVGFAIFTVGSLLCGLSQSALMLIISRGVQGVGGAILFATSLALLAHSFRGRDRGIAFGVWGAVTGIATSLGPILGGVITSGISWRGIFLVNVPIGIVAIALTLWKVEESRPPVARRPDWAGFAVLTAGLVGLVYGLIRAGETAWTDTGVLVCLGLGVALLAVFVAVEARVAHPMFDLSLLRTPTFLGGSLSAIAMNGSLFAMFVYLVLYLQNDLGYSALGAGLRLLVVSGASFVAATAAGRLSSVVPARWLIGPGLLLVGIGLLLMGGIDADSSWTHLIPGFVVAGFGSGMVNPPLASTAVGVVEPARSGMASGANTTFRQIGLAISIATLGSTFASRLASGIDDALTGVPALRGQGDRIADTLRQGDADQLFATTAPTERGALAHAIHAGFAGAINDLLLISATIALVGGVCALALIRRRDFIAHGPATGAAGPTGAAGGTTTGTSISGAAAAG
ncbi:Drug resistance transporter, EmrB/QacA subfamily [Frankia canadensis]|uniref:Drug resistance transporter, EmrB/QacA subfamily n=1 Tax=Frankia canadensis TaxID=1836972 RepID=A0A2I2KXJ2_9ACTN|nr:MFS transporter [Frankia canadensis]SNQ50380.1 Drug resistance transporter, EmrB/QacA subfamily [Frankia canadensis]SOU57670.1 Drug resistance transporter, EmrB/QacA subfamily [Frankia canadensis]